MDGEHVEQDKEQHREQGKAEDVGGWLEQTHLDQEEGENRQRIGKELAKNRRRQHSQTWWRRTARFYQL